MMARPNQTLDRARGALLGLALGDALGMPSQVMSRGEVHKTYGWIDDFVAPFDGHPVSHGLEAGMVTDDTEQSLLLAEQILATPDRFDEAAWAAALIGWEEGVRARGLLDLLGPSTKRALKRLEEGATPGEAGLGGTTNGAAMRISPLGIATPLEPLPRFLDLVTETCRITHNSAVAVAAAAAVGAAVSAGVSGADYQAAIRVGIQAAREADCRELAPGPCGMAARITAALALVSVGPVEQAYERLLSEIGTDVASLESVPTAFALVRLAEGDPWRAACLAANGGGDSDTIAAMAAAIAGACVGATQLPKAPVDRLLAANDLQLDPLIARLLDLRSERALSPAQHESPEG